MNLAASWRWASRGRGTAASGAGQASGRPDQPAGSKPPAHAPHAALAEAQSDRGPAAGPAGGRRAGRQHGRARRAWQASRRHGGQLLAVSRGRRASRRHVSTGGSRRGPSRAYVREMEWEAAQDGLPVARPVAEHALAFGAAVADQAGARRTAAAGAGLACPARRRAVRLASGTGRTERVSGQHALARLGRAAAACPIARRSAGRHSRPARPRRWTCRAARGWC